MNTHRCPTCQTPMTAKQATVACFGPTRAMHPATRPVRVAGAAPVAPARFPA